MSHLGIVLVFASFGQVAGDDLPLATKALISKLLDDSKSKLPSVRASAYKSIGELGENGKSLRRQLCNGMLDTNIPVRQAAADSLNKIDPKMNKFALAVFIDRDWEQIRIVGEMKGEAEPLVSLINAVAASRMPIALGQTPDTKFAISNVRTCIDAMAKIAPEDAVANNAVIAMLTNTRPDLRACGVNNLAAMKNRKLALPTILKIAKTAGEFDSTRIQAIALTPILVDENTKVATRKVVDSLRFDASPGERHAVEVAVNALDEKTEKKAEKAEKK